MPAGASVHDVRQVVTEMASEAVALRKTKHDVLHRRFIRTARKNWSSLVLWNMDHPGTKRLTLDMVNELPGRDLQ